MYTSVFFWWTCTLLLYNLISLIFTILIIFLSSSFFKRLTFLISTFSIIIFFEVSVNNSLSSNQNVTGIVVNEKVQVSAKYRKEIRQEIYYIRKFGLESHLKKRNIDIEKEKYINILYGKILYVLQINNKDNEFNEYKKFMNNFKNKF